MRKQAGVFIPFIEIGSQGEKDYEKYETARRLKTRIDDIRAVYTADWKSKEMRVRQRAVALYFIDKVGSRRPYVCVFQKTPSVVFYCNFS